MKKRWLWLAAAVTVALTAKTVFDDLHRGQSEVALPVARSSSAAVSLETRLPASRGRAQIPAVAHDLFASRAVVAPQAAPLPPTVPPPTAPIQASEKPAPPQLPYRFFGRISAPNGKMTVYIQKENELIAIEREQVVDGSYRVDSIDQEKVVFRFLPMDVPIELPIPLAPVDESMRLVQ